MNFKKIKSDIYDYEYFRECKERGIPYITINEKSKYYDLIVDCDSLGAEIYDKVQNYIDKNYNALYGELESFIKLHQKTDGFTYRLGCFNRLRIELGFAEEIANKLYDKLMDIIYNKLNLKGECKYINSEDKNRIETILKSYHFMKSKIKIIDIDIDLLDHGITDDIIYTKEELVSKKKNIIEIKKKLDDLIPRLDNHSRKFIEMKYLQGEKYNNIRKELKLSPVAAKELSEQIYIKVYNCLF